MEITYDRVNKGTVCLVLRMHDLDVKLSFVIKSMLINSIASVRVKEVRVNVSGLIMM